MAETGPLCAETDPELFFPEMGVPSRFAKAVCARCSLKDACLEEAITMPFNPEGVWGGTNKDERRALRAQRSIDDVAA